MLKRNPFKYFKTSHEIIRLAVMYYLRYPLSFRQLEDILHERGIDISHETIRFWVERFGLEFAGEIRRKRRGFQSNWRWHVDEVFVKINGELHYLWRAIDHEGEVLECYVSRRRNKEEALKFLKKTMRKHGAPKEIVTDKLRSYGAALKEIQSSGLQETGVYLNNRCENSHLPFRRKERSMQKFRSRVTLQLFTSIHSQIYNHFNHQRHLQKRATFKQQRIDSLSEWRGLCAG
ncbi:MAG: putative transposase [Pseudoalteromonas tetraodonis]|jgi:putative transposase